MIYFIYDLFYLFNKWSNNLSLNFRLGGWEKSMMEFIVCGIHTEMHCIPSSSHPILFFLFFLFYSFLSFLFFSILFFLFYSFLSFLFFSFFSFFSILSFLFFSFFSLFHSFIQRGITEEEWSFSFHKVFPI
jgi:hypothetical protein